MRKIFLITLLTLIVGTGASWAATINVPADQPTIEDAILAAGAGDIILVANGIYDPPGTLGITQALTISGASEAGVIINIPTALVYGFTVTASDVLLENFTLVANTTNTNYPIHASGTSNPTNGFDNLTLQNITVQGVHRRTGFDIHGYNTVLLSNLTSSDATGGNGVQITGCVDVTVNNITTLNNAWGSFAIYSSGSSYLNRGSDNVNIDGASCSFGEGNLFNQDEFGLFNTNITVSGYGYLVRNFNFRPDAAGYTFFQDTEANAVAHALALDATAPGSFINLISDGSLLVATGMAIQPAIDAASPGDAIDVGAGHYEEQLYVNKDNLSITGAGVGVTYIDSPTDLTLSYTTSAANFPVVFVDSADGVNFADLTLDGLGRGNANYRFQGFGYYNAGGSLTNVHVANIMDTPFSGAQHGNGIYCITDDASAHVFNMTDVLVDGFQKTGAVVAGAGVTGTLLRVTTTGEGATPTTAQNGIQISGGALADVTDCDAAGIAFTGADWTATGLLVFGPSTVTFDGCTVTGSQTGVYFVDGGGAFNNGSVSLPLGDALFAYSTAAKSLNQPRALPQGFDAGPGENANKAAISVSIDNSTFTGTNAVDSWGPTAFGYGPVTFSMTNSTVTNWDWGVVAYDFGGAVINATVNENTITNNLTYGFYANTANVQDVERNYWGVADPTAIIDLSASVDFSPWYGLPLGSSPMTIGTNDSIQDAIDLAVGGDTINAVAATFVAPAQIVVDKDLTITGAGVGSTIITPGFNTSVGYYLVSDALMYVDYGVTATIEELAIDGTGFTVRHAIQSRGADLTVRNCEIRDIFASIYAGRGIVFLAGTGLVENCTMSNIQRIGVHIRGGVEPTAPVVAVDGLTYTGKGVGDFLDYGIEFGGGGIGTVANSIITACLGVATLDGSDSAGILVTDYYGTGTTADITNTTLTGNSTGVVVGYDVSDISAVTINGSTISDNTTAGVTTTGVTVDALGNWWGTALGPFHPTLNPAGTGNEVSDNILFDPWSGMTSITATPATSVPLACGVPDTLTFSLTTDDYTPDVFGYNIVVRATSEVSFGAITHLNIFGGTSTGYYNAFSPEAGVWDISGTTFGSPSAPITTAGTHDLFTIIFTPDSDGLAEITFDLLKVRDPDNGQIPVSGTGATILVDCTAPAAVTAITAAPGHNKVDVGWTHDGSDVDHYEVFSGVWHDGANVSAYPEYDDLVGNTIPTAPADYATAVGSGEWLPVLPVATASNQTQTWSDHLNRGVYYYTVFAVDAAGNVSAAPAALDRATNYWLGDVTGMPSGAPNGEVQSYDITALGTSFGLSEGVTGYNNETDVGPTDDWSRVGIPLTDSIINFEDLIVFSMNFGVVAPSKNITPISKVVDLAWVRYDDGRQALRLMDGSGVKGLNVRTDTRITGVEAGDLLDQQADLTFLRNVGETLDVSVAVMGTGVGFAGSGDLFVIDADSPIEVKDLTIKVRGHDNSKLEFKMNEKSDSLTPRVFALNPNYPNPFNPMTKISFSLPEAHDVRLAVYGIDGRKVATLLNEQRGPGLHEVIWTGQDDAGRQAASGMYFYRIDAGPYSQVRKMTLMK